jgi:hypothetical protein
MKCLIISVGGKNTSLGAHKLAAYLRRLNHVVDHVGSMPLKVADYDLFCFSVVFSWHLPETVRLIRFAKLFGEVWVGGPAVTFHPDNARYIESQTGIKPHIGLDDRFEREPGKYPMVYFSRGCPAYTPACGVCPVPRMEGNSFTFYPESQPATLLLDNNLSALPVDYQEHIIAAYQGFPRKVDAQSGFEPHTFTEETLHRWERFPLLCWRFGYDDLTERNECLTMLGLLNANGYRDEKVRIYTLIGNEPIQDCYQRVREVIGDVKDPEAHPKPQRLRPLNWLGPDGTLPCRFDWDEPTLIAFQRFYSLGAFWKRMKPSEFYYQGRYPLAMLN